MKILIVTGMSGAGKSQALRCLEDIGYFCIDNLPPLLVPKFLELYNSAEVEKENIALGMDIRGGKLFNDLFSILSEMQNENQKFEILFFDAQDDILLKRYKETRRTHPLAKNGRLVDGIKKERELLEFVKSKANYIIDTSFMLTRELKEKINEIFLENKEFDSMIVNVLSFGFKYGLPNDADLVFDVRFIPNPFYIAELKCLTGNDIEVRRFVMSFKESKVFLQMISDMCKFLIPNYIKEGKNQLVIAIGCTGGKHRSVTLANELYTSLVESNHNVLISHRDIDKDSKR